MHNYNAGEYYRSYCAMCILDRRREDPDYYVDQLLETKDRLADTGVLSLCPQALA